MINYYLLMKPGIILGNLITVMAGFLLASQGRFSLVLFLSTLLGLALIMGSGCVFNNILDRKTDQKMVRTKNRPLVRGLVSMASAASFGALLLLLGNFVLYSMTNLLTVTVADMGFLIYVVFYTLWKVHTVYGTAIGSLAGAVPPVVGYTAVKGELDLGAVLLFMMMIFWQMPHFFSIAFYHLEDYKRAQIPVLPLVKGGMRTKIHMVLYIIAFIFVASLFTYFGYTGLGVLFIAVGIGLAWLLLGLKGFQTVNNYAWGRQMFRLSLVLITALSFAIILENLLPAS